MTRRAHARRMWLGWGGFNRSRPKGSFCVALQVGCWGVRGFFGKRQCRCIGRSRSRS